MTKDALLQDLASSFVLGTLIDDTEVLSETDKNFFSQEKLKIYRQIVHEKVDDKMVRRAIPFYVKDEGGPGESAYYKDSTPESRIVPKRDFRDRVLAMLKNRAEAKQILAAGIIDLDEDGKWATVRIFKDAAGTATEELYFVWHRPGIALGYIPKA